MVAGRLDIIDSNLAIFTLSGLFSLIPAAEPVFTGKIAFIRPDLACILAILAFGFITGMGFYLNAKAIPWCPLYGSRDPEHDGRIRHSLGRILLSRNGHWLDHRRNSRFYDRGHRAADEE